MSRVRTVGGYDDIERGSIVGSPRGVPVRHEEEDLGGDASKEKKIYPMSGLYL